MGNYLQLIIIIIKVFAILLFPQETHLQSWILQLFPILLILTWLELGKKLLTSHKLSLLSTLSKPSHFQQWTIYFLCLSILSPTLSFSCLSLSLNFSAPCCPLLFSRGVFFWFFNRKPMKLINFLGPKSPPIGNIPRGEDSLSPCSCLSYLYDQEKKGGEGARGISSAGEAVARNFFPLTPDQNTKEVGGPHQEIVPPQLKEKIHGLTHECWILNCGE